MDSINHSAVYLDTKDLASRLHKSAWWVYTNYKTLGIPYFKAGREILFPLAGVEDWERRQFP
jgi:hypothetical protein